MMAVAGSGWVSGWIFFMSLRLLASWIWLLAAAVPAGCLLPLRDAWLMALLHVIAASTLVPWC